MGNVPPSLPVTPQGIVMCPSCLGVGHHAHGDGGPVFKCTCCQGFGTVTTTKLANVNSLVRQWANGGFKESLVTMCEVTGLTQNAIDNMLDEICPQQATPIAAPVQPVQPVSIPMESILNPDEDFTDDRPEIESFSLHTLSGKSVLKLTVLGKRHYAKGELVSNRDFLNDGISLTNPPKMPPGPHRFRGKVQASLVDLQPNNQIKQNLEIALTQHSLIDSGHYKGRGVLKSSAVMVVATEPKPTVLPANEPIPGMIPQRKFKLE